VRLSAVEEECHESEKNHHSSVNDVVLYERWVPSSTLDDVEQEWRSKWNKRNVSRDVITWRNRQTQTRTHNTELATKLNNKII